MNFSFISLSKDKETLLKLRSQFFSLHVKFLFYTFSGLNLFISLRYYSRSNLSESSGQLDKANHPHVEFRISITPGTNSHHSSSFCLTHALSHYNTIQYSSFHLPI
jgi:hypothetical protein